MMETKAAYIAEVDPFEILRQLLNEADVLQIIKGVQAIKESGGWGEIRLPFKEGHITQGAVTHSTVGNTCKP